jgi:hypothetical protein
MRWMRWFRPGSRSIALARSRRPPLADIVDIERLLQLQGPRLDRAYVRRWLVDSVGEGDVRVLKWDEICTAIPA